jgi:L-rhamnose mutarotase
MKKKTIKEVIDTLYLKYKCIDNEDIWVEITDKYICINWNSFMSSFVSKYAESETDCILFAQVHIIANI